MGYEYRSNSNKSKEKPEKKRAQKIVSGPVRSRKKSGLKKLANVFVQEDIDSVKSFIFTDVLVPALKKLVWDVITGGTDMALFGGSGAGKRKTNAGRVSYRSYYDEKRDRHSTPVRGGYDFDDVILDNRGEAENVLSAMDDIIDIYGVVSVLDYYDLTGYNSTPTDNKYGWTNIRSAEIVRLRDGGYVIKLPKALPID